MTTARGADEDRRTLWGYFHAFGPAPEWDELPRWPPDVFTLANLVLDHTESYRFAVAPPSRRRWPPFPDWSERVRAAAVSWRDAVASGDGPLPSLLVDCWATVTRRRDAPLTAIRSGAAWELTSALLTLHAIADEACAGIGSFGGRVARSAFEERAWTMLQSHGSLARLSPTRVRIVPKTHFSVEGITIRSLSRHLALCYESVEVRYRATEASPADRGTYTILLVPWPLSVTAQSFRPAPLALIDNMDPEHFRFFEFAPAASPDAEFLDALLHAAAGDGDEADAVVFPEGALRPEAVAGLEEVLARHGVSLLIAGAAQPPSSTAFGRNYLHIGVRTGDGWNRYEQDKHHRWCLDERQIRQYHLSRTLRPTTRWWEAIDICARTLHVIDVGAGVTAAPLVCEDLGRLDEVADLVRRIGPSLVVAVLLDGPQLLSRWSSRYASVIADDPGSVVLTLTSLGMVTRCRPPGTGPSRVVAHWKDRVHGTREIALAPGATGVLLTTAVEGATLWTADGRRHPETPRLRLVGVRQLRGAARPSRRSAGARPLEVIRG